jgi:hypothetical protein
VELRLNLHGIAVQPAPDFLVRELGPGYFIRMTQPLRGLIPPLLDPQAVEPMVDGVRLQESSSPFGQVRCAQAVSIASQSGMVAAGLNDYTTD